MSDGMEEVGAIWTLHRTGDVRFPFRLAIEQGGRTLLALRTRERWPGPGMQIFCLRESDGSGGAGGGNATAASGGGDPPELVERLPVVSIRRLGRKLAVILDRPTRKRCDFLFLTRPYKGREGEYEQIFWRTEQAVRAHRTRSRPQLQPTGDPLEIAVDVAERYPWAFPTSHTTRRKLAVGDYALIHQDRVVALVERKTFENLLQEIALLQILHQKLAELEAFPHAALVIEAQYGDFLDRSRIGRWTARYLARVLAEISVVHPKLPVIYAGNRKLANEWTAGYFAGVAARLADRSPQLVSEALAGYARAVPARGADEAIRLAILHELPEVFTLEQLRRHAPQQDDLRLRRVLGALRAEGRLANEGRGRAARWVRRGPANPAT